MKLIQIGMICSFIISFAFSQGQLTCDEIKQLAVQKKQELTQLIDTNEFQRRTNEQKRSTLLNMGIVPPDSTYYSENTLPVGLDRQFDEWRGYRQYCSRHYNRNGSTTWGEVLFWRIVNLQIQKAISAILLSDNQELDRLLYQGASLVDDSHTNTPSLNTISTPNGFEARHMTFPETGAQIDIVKVDPTINKIRTIDRMGRRPYDFGELDAFGIEKNRPLLFAINAGMYQPDRTPVGLLIKRGQVSHPINQNRQGQGNFYMQPNGVFYVTESGEARVLSTDRYLDGIRDRTIDERVIETATQSGPLMIENGVINSLFTPGSRNLHFRNAVGVTSDGMVVFAISKNRVNFYEFSDFLLSQGCINALYLDGEVSRMYAPSIGETNSLHDSSHLGPVFYILSK